MLSSRMVRRRTRRGGGTDRIVGDGLFNLFAGGNREAIILLRAKIGQLRNEIILGTEYVMRGRGSRIIVMR